jgi:glycyl-tRNA synthetase
VEYRFPFGWKEIEGIASRTDYDLRAHQEGSGKPLTWYDEPNKRWVTPYVVEPAAGLDRCFLVVLCEAYEEEVKPNGETRVVLHLHPKLAAVQAGVYPLVKRDGMPERARALHAALRRAGVRADYDEGGTIGKRYSRMDEVGTPYGVTVDSQTLADGTVTVRDRDTMAQERVSEDAVADFLRDRMRAWSPPRREGAGA